MSEQIIQGSEDPVETAKRKAEWAASAADRLPENSSTRLEDVVKALLENGILTLEQMKNAKRNRDNAG